MEKLRAWWWRRQGLDGRLAGRSAAAVLAETGWGRSLGGVGPYLTLFARAGLGREAVDAAVAALEIHELPSARGCTYLLPASDYALGLKVGEAFSGAEMKTAAKLGVTEAEIAKLSEAVLRALERGPLDPEQVREAVGGAARSLGPEGVKKGVTTTLPVALGKLQAAGRIRRISVNGRLDQQRYRYALWSPSPLRDFRLSAEEAATELASRYFRWIGPATLAEFQWFSGLGAKAAKAAAAPLGLVPLEDGDPRLLFPDDRERLKSFQPPSEPQYALVGSVDGIVLLRRDLKALLAAKDAARPELSKTDLPNHAILDRGRLIGLWDFDVESSSIAWCSFVRAGAELRKAVERTEEFIRAELGDARSFSLDSPKSRKPRIEALRKAAAAS